MFYAPPIGALARLSSSSSAGLAARALRLCTKSATASLATRVRMSRSLRASYSPRVHGAYHPRKLNTAVPSNAFLNTLSNSARYRKRTESRSSISICSYLWQGILESYS